MIKIIIQDLHEVNRIYQKGEKKEFGNPIFDVVVFAQSDTKESKGITNRNGEAEIDVEVGDEITLRIISTHHQVFDQKITVKKEVMIITLVDDEC